MRFFTFSILMIFMTTAYSQTVDYNQVIPSLDSGAVIQNFQDKLVAVAWQNYPTNGAFANRVNSAEAEIKQQKASWFNPITIQLNYGEAHILSTQNDFVFYPKYNLGVNFNIGDFLTTPHKIKKAEEGLEIAKSSLNAQKLRIRAEVIRRYQDYLRHLELLKLRIQVQEDSHNAYLDVTRRFREGSLPLDAYTEAALVYNRASEEKIQAEAEVNIGKAFLEELIAVPLESVR